ncbi:MAG: restriction endonuclease subunit S [Conchiformibius sp.]|nr:restriction endonuclease subunit S [Conchiformibius sp.]
MASGVKGVSDMTKHDKQAAPRLRFKGFDGAWEEKKIGEILSEVRRSIYLEDDKTYQLVTVKRRNEGVIYRGHLLGKDILVKNYSQLKTGDYLISKRQIIHGANGIVPSELDNAIVSNEYLIAVSNSEVTTEFLTLISLTPQMYRKFLLSSYGVDIEKMVFNVEDWKNREINLPILPEQTQLGNFFRQLDHRIVQSRALWEKSRQLKKAMLAKMFPAAGETAPKLRFKGFTGEWESKKLGELGYTFSGLTNKSRKDFGHGEARYITYMNVYQNAISSIEQLDSIEIDEKQNKVEKGDVLFTTSSETPEEVGMSSVWTFNAENVYLNSFCFGYRLNEKIDLNYLAYCLRSDYVRSQMILLAQGISRYNISKKGVMEITILIPNPEEQTAIGNFFRQLDDTIALQSAETEKLSRLKKALLAAMLV